MSDLPLDIIKVGQVVFMRETIHEQPSDCSLGGTFARRGDAVVVKSIRAAPLNFPSYPVDTCHIKWCYSVAHLDVTDGSSFTAYRDEIMPTDPLILIKEQRDYCQSGRYKTLESRFEKGVPFDSRRLSYFESDTE